MLFTYEMKINVGDGKTVTTEFDGELTVERDGSWTIGLRCVDSGEYEPVHSDTDLFKDICSYLVDKEFLRTQEAIDRAQRDARLRDKIAARI